MEQTPPRRQRQGVRILQRFDYFGGTFVWNAHTANGTPKIADALFAAGEFTTTGKTKKQIGNSANVWSVLRGASVSFDNPNGTTSFGSTCKVRYFGGTIISPVNTLISW